MVDGSRWQNLMGGSRAIVHSFIYAFELPLAFCSNLFIYLSESAVAGVDERGGSESDDSESEKSSDNDGFSARRTESETRGRPLIASRVTERPASVSILRIPPALLPHTQTQWDEKTLASENGPRVRFDGHPRELLE
jgi:hypothetical protein